MYSKGASRIQPVRGLSSLIAKGFRSLEKACDSAYNWCATDGKKMVTETWEATKEMASDAADFVAESFDAGIDYATEKLSELADFLTPMLDVAVDTITSVEFAFLMDGAQMVCAATGVGAPIAAGLALIDTVLQTACMLYKSLTRDDYDCIDMILDTIAILTNVIPGLGTATKFSKKDL